MNELYQELIKKKPIKRKKDYEKYLCPEKKRIIGIQNECFLLEYELKEKINEEDRKKLDKQYEIQEESIESFILSYLLNYFPFLEENCINRFRIQYSIQSNQDVLNLIHYTQKSFLFDDYTKMKFVHYLFIRYNEKRNGKKVLQNEILFTLLHVLYESYPLFSSFLSFLHSQNISFLTKDQWLCLAHFTHIIFLPQDPFFYQEYTSENSFHYPLLFDDFFCYLKNHFI